MSLTAESLVLEHCTLSGYIKRLLDIRDFLIDEMYAKKSLKRTPLNVILPVNEQNKYYMENVLFMGQKEISSANHFPSLFKSKLERVVFKIIKQNNLTEPFSVESIYYFRTIYPKGIYREVHDTAQKFDKSDFTLSDESKNLSENDISILEGFKQDLLDFMDYVIDIVLGNDINVNDLIEEKNRFQQLLE